MLNFDRSYYAQSPIHVPVVDRVSGARDLMCRAIVGGPLSGPFIQRYARLTY